MKSLHITGLTFMLLVYSPAGFSQNQVQTQQAQRPQNQAQATQQAQRPQSPVQQTQQSQVQTPPQTQAQARPQVNQAQNQTRPQVNQAQTQAQTQTNQATQGQRRVPPRQRAAEAAAAANNTPNLTERAKIKNEEASKTPEHVVWLREMYRSIDLKKDDNAALYYPVQSIGDRMNLFTTIFKLITDKKITAYTYRFGRPEAFTDDLKLNFENDVLKKYQILYKKDSTANNVRYIVDESDIPSSEVLEYQIKEASYFDAATGTYKTQVTAICPVLVRKDYSVGDTTRNAMFWIPYENLRPYLSRAMLMTSDYNNVITYSMDDFFSKGMYKGDIIQTVNMRDLSLVQQVGDDPEKLKLAQDSIENQLKTFRENLWVHQDSTQVAATNKAKKGKESTNKSAGATAKKENAQKEEKPKAAKPSTSATPTKTVRRTR